MADYTVKVVFDAEDKVSPVASRIQKSAGGVADRIQSAGKTALIALGTTAVAGAAALAKGLYDCVKAGAEAQKTQEQLKAVIKSTGGAAGWSADQANRLAGGLMRVTSISKGTIVQTQALLLTFTRISGQIMPDVTRAVLDMSVALKTDTKSAAIMVGKALNDPVRGLLALRRVGVSFTEEQQNQIKVLARNGKLMEAQKMILAELTKEFGGSAQAAGQTFAGRMAYLSLMIEDVKKRIGLALIPVLQKMFERYIVPNLPKLEKLGEALARLAVEAAPKLIEALARITPLIVGLANFVTRHREVLVGAFAAIGAAIMAYLVVTVHTLITTWGPIVGIFMAIEAAAALLYKAWQSDFLGIRTATLSAINAIRPYIQEAIAWLKTYIPPALTAARQAFSVAFNAIRTVVSAAISIVRPIIQAFLALIRGDFYGFGVYLREAWEATWRALVALVQALGPRVVAAVKALAAWVSDVFTNTDWLALGKAIILGIIHGLAAMDAAFKNAIRNLARAALNIVKGFLGIRSPSLVMQLEVGRPMVEGWIKGIQRALPDLERALKVAGGVAVQGAQQVVNNYNLTVNSQVTHSSIIRDFNLMRSLAW